MARPRENWGHLGSRGSRHGGALGALYGAPLGRSMGPPRRPKRPPRRRRWSPRWPPRRRRWPQGAHVHANQDGTCTQMAPRGLQDAEDGLQDGPSQGTAKWACRNGCAEMGAAGACERNDWPLEPSVELLLGPSGPSEPLSGAWLRGRGGGRTGEDGGMLLHSKHEALYRASPSLHCIQRV